MAWLVLLQISGIAFRRKGIESQRGEGGSWEWDESAISLGIQKGLGRGGSLTFRVG